MSHLWDIAQQHMDAYGVRAAALARKMDTAPQTLDSWKNRGIRELPDRRLLEALARVTQRQYVDVLVAALRDVDYWPDGFTAVPVPEERGGDEPTPMNPPDPDPGPRFVVDPGVVKRRSSQRQAR